MTSGIRLCFIVNTLENKSNKKSAKRVAMQNILLSRRKGP